jgi:hypothetical protein
MALSFLHWNRILVDTVDYSPIEYIVIIIAFLVKKVKENLFQVRIIWLVFETQTTTVMQIVRKLSRETRTDLLNWEGQLLLHDLLILLLKNLYL